MSDRHDVRGLFDRLIEVGDELLEAIDRQQFDRVADVLERRGRLLERLDQTPGADEPQRHPRWDTVRERLEEQHELIRAALTDRRDTIEEELQEMREYRTARTAYGSSNGSSRQILSESVRG